MDNFSPLEWEILEIIKCNIGKDLTGMQIRDRIKGSKPGLTVYVPLHRLEQKGYIASYWDETEKPRRRRYKIGGRGAPLRDEMSAQSDGALGFSF